MKIGKRIGISLAIGIVWLILYSFILWKIPFYVHINSLVLPAGSETFKVKVGITDEATWFHVVAQKVFISDWDEEDVMNFIEEKNQIQIRSGYRNLYRFEYFINMSHGESFGYESIINAGKYVDRIMEDDRDYYTILYTSMYDDTVIENVFYVAIFSEAAILILSMVLLTICGRKKKEGIKEAEAVTKGGM